MKLLTLSEPTVLIHVLNINCIDKRGAPDGSQLRAITVAATMMDNHWKSDWECMTIDDLFALREQVDEILRVRLKAKQAELDRRLQALAPATGQRRVAFANARK